MFDKNQDEDKDQDKNSEEEIQEEIQDSSTDPVTDDEDQEEESVAEEATSTDEEDSDTKEDISKSKVIVIREILRNIQSNLDQVFKLLGDENISDVALLTQRGESGGDEAGSKIVEGVFDGQNMIGPDGKQYTVPANYASKSKLVEGDILKLSITPKGDFIYKQIGPIERSRLIGTLAKNKETDDWFVLVNNKKYKVLSASVTYYKGDVSDEAVILVPKDSESNWAAVENIINKEAETSL